MIILHLCEHSWLINDESDDIMHVHCMHAVQAAWSASKNHNIIYIALYNASCCACKCDSELAI